MIGADDRTPTGGADCARSSCRRWSATTSDRPLTANPGASRPAPPSRARRNGVGPAGGRSGARTRAGTGVGDPQRRRPLQLLAGHGTGVLARRAAHFRLPIDVWHVEDRALLPAVAEPAVAPAAPSAPTSPSSRRSPPAARSPTSSTASCQGRCAGSRSVGSWTTRTPVPCGWRSVSAPTIARPSPSSTATCPPSRRWPAWSMPSAAHRSPGAPHPLNRLAPERLLRWRLEQEPSLIGLASLTPTQPPVPSPRASRIALRARRSGGGPTGHEVLVVCSVGVDLDLVPYAIDARLHEPGVDGEVVGGDGGPAVARSRPGDGGPGGVGRSDRCRWSASRAEPRRSSTRWPGPRSTPRCAGAQRLAPERPSP